MPLRDHFHSPVNDKHHWSALHGGWPMEIVRTLFDILPPPYQAGPWVYLGSSFEVSLPVAEEERGHAPTLTVEADLSDQDEYEVRIYDPNRERRLVAAVEIVSPSNKDRPDTREQFVGKVAALLRQDVCVAVVDLVSTRQANLYAELLARLGRSDPHLGEPPPPLYAVSLRARRPPKRHALLDAWFYPMAVGRPLPTPPLWLAPDLRVELPLEPSYQETCRLLHIA
ncbi:hypothetical protein J0H58_37970 [bacterium]|nr:hypothetical protein [bacterium]